jgi:hypothetical protein
MKAEHPAENSSELFSLVKSTIAFGAHQFVGVYGIPFTAPLVFSLSFKLLYLLGHTYSKRNFYSVVSETPYFPVQIVFALILGWLLGRSLRHKSVFWVWVIPLAVMCYVFFTAHMPLAEEKSIFVSHGFVQSRLSHFFGWGCRPAARCFDQVLFTLPFYSSLAYSAGAFAGRKTVRSIPVSSRKLSLAVMLTGVTILFAIAVDLIVSVHLTGWQRTYWLILATPAGLGAYLLHVASTVRRQLTVSQETFNQPVNS